MGSISTKFRTAFRRYITDGVPGSGANQPDKAQIIDAGDEVDSVITGIQNSVNALVIAATSGVIGFATLSAMNADLAHPAGTIGRVMSDTTPSNNGDYRKTGASGAGSWVKQYDNSKVIHVKVGVSGGDGSTATPYNIAEAIAAIAADTSRDRIKVVLLAGTHRITTEMRFNAVQWRNVEIQAATGMNADIYCSVVIASSTAAFTQPDAGGHPHVWMCSNRWGATVNGTTTLGGLIDLANSSACGRSGVYRSPVTVYTDIGNDQSLATMENSTYAGCQSLITTGGNAGKIYVHAIGGVDPNTINWEQSVCEKGIWVTAPLGTDFNGTRLSVNGVRVLYHTTAGVWTDRCRVDVQNVSSLYGRTYGLQFNESDVLGVNCETAGTAADGVNLNGSMLDSSVPDHKLKATFIDCKFNGCQQMVVPPVAAQVVGDCISNHYQQQMYVIDCELLGATKDGGSMLDNCRFVGCLIEDCFNGGITQVAQNASATSCVVKDTHIKGCHTGLLCTSGTGNPGGSLPTISATRVIFENSSDRDMHATGDQVSTINARDCSYIGAIPTSGRVVVDTSGVVNIIESIPASAAAPVTKTGTTSSTGTDDSIIFNASGTHTHTLPAAASFPGRVIEIRTIAAQAINSASSNVVPVAGGAAGTAMLAATAGKWAALKSDGTNWQVMRAG